MDIRLNSFMRESLSNPHSKVWIGGTQLSVSSGDLVEKVVMDFKDSPQEKFSSKQVSGTTVLVWYHLATATACSSEELLANLGRVYANSWQSSIRGPLAYEQRRRFSDQLSVLVESGIPNSKRIVTRLQNLLEMAMEEDPENPTPIDLDSLGTMVEFFTKTHPKRYPDIALSPDGLLFVEWWDTPDKLLSLLFLPDGNAKLLLIQQNESKGPKKERVSALKGIESLISFLYLIRAFPT